MVDETEKSVIEGVRSPDNCYLLTPPTTCLKMEVDEAEMWHCNLGHENYRSMKRTVSVCTTCDIPDLKSETWKFYAQCLEGKEVEVSHKVLQHLATT